MKFKRYKINHKHESRAKLIWLRQRGRYEYLINYILDDMRTRGTKFIYLRDNSLTWINKLLSEYSVEYPYC